MTPDHYECLGVVPGSEDAVIRAAYRALMRRYHPDMNDDPQAQARAREINSAFAVLGDPEKRAAYDVLRAFVNEPGTGEPLSFAAERPLPPMRKTGLVSVALALALSLAFAVRPEWPSAPRLHERGTAADPNRTQVAPAADLVTAPKTIVVHVNETAGLSHEDASEPVPPPRPSRDMMSKQSDSRILPLPERAIAQAKPKALAQLPVVAAPASSAVSGSPAVANCHQSSSRAANGECGDDPQAQIERTAAGFLKQSMEHADWHKQQLLLSARNRSATSRNLCRSDDCVTDAYLHQIRDITTIMAGNIPTP